MESDPHISSVKPTSARSSGRFKWFNLLRLLGIIIFVVVIARTNVSELWHWIVQTDLWFFSLALLFQVLLLVFKCFRWYMMNEKGFKLKDVYQRFGEFLEGYAIGVVTPGRMGEILKAGHSKGRSGVISSGLMVISERGLDLSVFILVAGIAPVMGLFPHLHKSFGWFLIAAAILGIILAYSILIFPQVFKAAETLSKWLRIISKEQSLKFVPRSFSYLASFTVLTLFGNLSAFLSLYYIALSIMINIGIIPVTGSVALVGVINTIPVTIMGLGTRDVTLLYVLNEIPRAQVLAFSGLILVISQIGGGVIALLSGQYLLYRAKRMKSDT